MRLSHRRKVASKNCPAYPLRQHLIAWQRITSSLDKVAVIPNPEPATTILVRIMNRLSKWCRHG